VERYNLFLNSFEPPKEKETQTIKKICIFLAVSISFTKPPNMKKYSIEIKWAIIFVVMSLLWMVIEKMAGLHSTQISKHAIFTNFVALPAILIYVLALLDKRKNFYHGRMSFKQGFISGLVITLIVTLLSPLTQYITSTFITPEYFPNVINYSVSSGKMTQEEAETFFNLRSYIIQGLIGAAVMGLITSAIVALFTKTRKDNPVSIF
jgi:hypothetical protein